MSTGPKFGSAATRSLPPGSGSAGPGAKTPYPHEGTGVAKTEPSFTET